MKQIIQNYRTGEIQVVEMPELFKTLPSIWKFEMVTYYMGENEDLINPAMKGYIFICQYLGG
jgi:hypothetical protein